MADYFEDCRRGHEELAAKEISNWLLGEVSRIMNAENIDIARFRERVSPEQLCRLISASHGVISAATAKSVLDQMFQTGKEAASIIEKQGLRQISETSELETQVMLAIKENGQAVADYRAGKAQALKFLVGQVMRATKGRANPQVVSELLTKKLEEGSAP
jgi:aspartyl-tRNA(Asn)/glutamyl-tRNA(Gln) amidotransferase subunit B